MLQDERSIEPNVIPDPRARQPHRPTLVGVFDRAESAEAVARDLLAAGCSTEDISLAAQRPDRPPQIGAEGTSEDRGALAGVGIGAVLGGVAGLLAVALPGVGPIIAAGPLAAVLGGAAAGGTLGGIIGSLVGLGITEDRARDYEAELRAGHALLLVQSPPSAVTEIRQILVEGGARRVEDYPSEP